MSITSALLGLGIALTVAGGIGTFAAIIETIVMMGCGERRERKQAVTFLAIVAGVLSVGAFLLGLTIPAVQS